MPSATASEQVRNTGGDELHGAGDETGLRRGNGLPLVRVDADAERAFIGGDFLQCAVAGHTAGAEDHIRTLVDGLLSSGGAPLRIGEGLGQLAGMEGGDDVDVGIHVLGAGLVAFLEGHDGRNQVGAQHGGDGAGFGQACGQCAGEEAGLILVEYQAGNVRQRLTLELVDADELDVRVRVGGLNGGLAEGETDGDDDVVARRR